MPLDGVEASPAAEQLARETDKDPSMVELNLQESTQVVHKAPGVIFVRHRLGYVTAYAGIDQSNVDHRDGHCALRLPEDPDLSARRLRESLMKSTGRQLGVGGAATKGPTVKMMKELSIPNTAREVAAHYGAFLQGFVLDAEGADLEADIKSLGLATAVTNTVMVSLDDRVQLVKIAFIL